MRTATLQRKGTGVKAEHTCNTLSGTSPFWEEMLLSVYTYLNFMRNFIDKVKLFVQTDKEFRTALYGIMGFYPHNVEIYRIAFAHKSQEYKSKKSGDRPLNNERLEFLGDAVLETVVSDIVYHRFQNKREGFLTNTRSKIVSRESLGRIAKEIGLERLIQSHTYSRSHNSFIAGNAFEALMGAIYLDRGFGYAFRFFEKKIIEQQLNLENVAQKEVNFKSKLLEYCQKNRLKIVFKDKQDAEKPNSPAFSTSIVIEGLFTADGKGYSKKEAHQSAAREALLRMRREPKFEDSIYRAKESRTAMEADPCFVLPVIDEIEADIAREKEERDAALRGQQNNEEKREERKNARKNARKRPEKTAAEAEAAEGNVAEKPEDAEKVKPKAAKSEKPARAEKPAKAEKAPAAEKAPKTPKGEKNAKAEKPARTAGADKAAKDKDKAAKDAETSAGKMPGAAAIPAVLVAEAADSPRTRRKTPKVPAASVDVAEKVAEKKAANPVGKAETSEAKAETSVNKVEAAETKAETSANKAERAAKKTAVQENNVDAAESSVEVAAPTLEVPAEHVESPANMQAEPADVAEAPAVAPETPAVAAENPADTVATVAEPAATSVLEVETAAPDVDAAPSTVEMAAELIENKSVAFENTAVAPENTAVADFPSEPVAQESEPVTQSPEFSAQEPEAPAMQSEPSARQSDSPAEKPAATVRGATQQKEAAVFARVAAVMANAYAGKKRESTVETRRKPARPQSTAAVEPDTDDVIPISMEAVETPVRPAANIAAQTSPGYTSHKPETPAKPEVDVMPMEVIFDDFAAPLSDFIPVVDESEPASSDSEPLFGELDSVAHETESVAHEPGQELPETTAGLEADEADMLLIEIPGAAAEEDVPTLSDTDAALADGSATPAGTGGSKPRRPRGKRQSATAFTNTETVLAETSHRAEKERQRVEEARKAKARKRAHQDLKEATRYIADDSVADAPEAPAQTAE